MDGLTGEPVQAALTGRVLTSFSYGLREEFYAHIESVSFQNQLLRSPFERSLKGVLL